MDVRYRREDLELPTAAAVSQENVLGLRPLRKRHKWVRVRKSARQLDIYEPRALESAAPSGAVDYLLTTEHKSACEERVSLGGHALRAHRMSGARQD